MNTFARWGAALALLPIAACATNPPPVAAAPPAPPPLSAQDQSFIAMAAARGMDEVQEGNLAAKQAGRSAIRRFGQKMVDDHTVINQQLMAIAAAAGVTPPPQLTDADQATLTRLQHLHGRRFDMVYLHDQVADHQKMVALLRQEIDQGSDPRLKAFAQQTLPMVEQHLAMAQDIAGIRHPRPPAA